MSHQPAALQLRYLQTLSEIGGGDHASTIVFPLPLDLIKPLLEGATKAPPPASEQTNGELPDGARVGELPKAQ